jgi:toxin-antitoxin system PIN domain toxin
MAANGQVAAPLISLLDLNVLVALFDQDSSHHEAAHRWFESNRVHGWATTPITEAGLIRIVSNQTYTGTAASASDLRERLQRFCRSGYHTFWPDSISFRDDLFNLGSTTHRQLTDVYLLGLAVHNHGRLATFDRRITLGSVRGAVETSIEFIPE